jgi:hypothetical protein
MANETELVAAARDKTRPADERAQNNVEDLTAIENPSHDVWNVLCEIFNDGAADTPVRVAAVRTMGKRFPAVAPNQLCRYAAGDSKRYVRRAAVAVLEQIERVPEQTE